ncbi:MAG: beta-galactosidase trimerization domain-containing protein [Terracidiphilus sp.]
MALNRRDFIGAMIASTSLGTLGESLATGQAPSTSGQGEWLTRNGMVDAGGTHEPLIFIVRRGGQRTDALATSRYQQSEELIRKLHQQGVEVFHTSLYKGFGMAAEKEGMEQTREAVAIAHRYGVKADTYVQWGSLMYETFFAEEPRAEQWIERDIAGLPILLTYGYQQSFRYNPCFSHQEYIDYLKKVIRYAIVDVKTDFIHLDNFGLNAEPDSCHCSLCVKGFRNFLNRKYNAKQLRERFGFENISFVNPPQWNRNNRPENMEIIYDPAFQEWIDFRCQLMADSLQQISEYAKSLNPEVALEINPGGLNGENHTWLAGVDHSRLLKFTECFWSEEANPQAFHSEGRLVSKIRSYKLARAYNNIVLTSNLANHPVALGETLAFNQTIGSIGLDEILPATERYIDFYRKNRDLYLESEDVAPVALFRSYASLTYHGAHAQLSAILTEQALIQSRIPFVLAFDEHLQNLSAYKVLILPNSECLSDEQIALIRRFVESGGGLVVTEQAGLYDEWRRSRVQPGLSGLVEGQFSATDYQERMESDSSTPAAAVRKQAGRGRVAYVPSIVFDGTLPSPEPYFTITNRFWKRPKNWQEMIDAVNWAAGDPLPFAVEGPEYLAANYTYQPRHQRYLVHLVNYNATNVPLINDVQVRIALPEGKRPSKITQFGPESGDARKLNFTNEGARTRFTVPEMSAYALIAVEL